MNFASLLRATAVGALALFAAGTTFPGAANANLVLVGGNPPVPVATPAASFTDIGAQGFGAAPRLLTLQTNTFESGSVTPVDVVNGDAVPGANKSTTPTLSTLGWNFGSQVGIGFNSDQSGGTGITLDTLVLTIFNGTTSVGSFSLAAPITFSARIWRCSKATAMPSLISVSQLPNRRSSIPSGRWPARVASSQDWRRHSAVGPIRLRVV